MKCPLWILTSLLGLVAGVLCACLNGDYRAAQLQAELNSLRAYKNEHDARLDDQAEQLAELRRQVRSHELHICQLQGEVNDVRQHLWPPPAPLNDFPPDDGHDY